jgi:hypothetical protein
VQREERSHLRDARGLLHVVRDDHERVLALELVHQVLDRLGGDRVECRGRLVQKDHVRLHCERPRDAEALLLTARQGQRARLQPILDLVPEGGAVQRALDALVEVLLHAQRLGREGDVVVDRLRKRVRALEHHADPPPHLDRIDIAAVDVRAVVEDRAPHRGAGHEVVHPVQAADEGALAAPGRADHGRDLILEDVEADAAERRRLPVVDGEIVDVEDDLSRSGESVVLRARDLDRLHHRHETSVPVARTGQGRELVNVW